MRFLLQSKTGKILAYTPELAKRTDMTEVSAEIAAAVRINRPLPVQAQAEDIEPREQHSLPTEEVPPELNEVATIMAFDDKTALEEWARAKGIELDRRKSLANLKQETLQFLGHQTEG
jgi:hypothetical protein